MELEYAREVGLRSVKMLEKYCTRIELAGSIRREKAAVKDIEIVCIAKSWHLEKGFCDMRHWGMIFTKFGLKYKRFLKEGVWHDIFICDERNWGLIYMIRTGSVEFNFKWLKKLPNDYFVKDGRLWKSEILSCEEVENKIIDVPEEQVLFDIMGIKFVEPKDRI